MDQEVSLKQSAEDIVPTVISVISQTLNHSSEIELTKDTQLAEDLGLDSMSTLAFLMALEDEIEMFSIDPDTLEAAHFVSVGTISEYVISRLESD